MRRYFPQVSNILIWSENRALICGKGRDEIAKKFCKDFSPRQAAKPLNVGKTQRGYNSCAIYNGRPLGLTGPPIQIYHPVFTTFIKDSLDATAELTHELLDVAVKLVNVSVAHYINEDQRRKALVEVLGPADYIPTLSSEFTLGSGINSTHAGEGQQVPFQILELKNEIGAGGSDPITQAEFAYAKIFSAPEVGLVLRSSPL
jgi:hypothetical protein